MSVGEVDGFWIEAQRDLEGLPRPDLLLEALKGTDPFLHRRLVKGELWLLRQTEVAVLREGWSQWLRLYRKAVDVTRCHTGT